MVKVSDYVYNLKVGEPAQRSRTKKINLVLIAGKAGAGKTETASFLYHELVNMGLQTSHTSFAKPIKMIAHEVFGWDGKKNDKGRRLLQVIGTEAGREYNEDLWVQYLEREELSEVFPNNFVLVDDWRYPNERDYFLGNPFYDVTTIRVERPDNPYLSENGMEPISENSLPSAETQSLVYNIDSYYNFSIFNDGTLNEFYNKLNSSVLEYLRTKVIYY